MDTTLLKIDLNTCPDYLSIPENLKKSAVMVLLQKCYGTWHFVLIERAKEMSLHSGEIAFAGGRCDEDDSSPIDTALREVNEELGIPASEIEVLGSLKFVMTLTSGYGIIPIVGILNRGFNRFVLEPAEVQELLIVPVELFEEPPRILGPEYFFLKGHYYQEKVIWGATQRVIQEFLKSVNS